MWSFFSNFMCFLIVAFLPRLPDGEQDHDPTLYKNVNSVYDANDSDISTSSSSTTAAAIAPEEDSSAAIASHRLTFSPGSSNSILELLDPPPPPQDSDAVVGGSVAVQIYSPDPYSDFRESMLEMIKSRDVTDEPDWDFLNELLLCYLTLNRKCTHKSIVAAYTDVIVSLVSPPSLPCQKTHIQPLESAGRTAGSKAVDPMSYAAAIHAAECRATSSNLIAPGGLAAAAAQSAAAYIDALCGNKGKAKLTDILATGSRGEASGGDAGGR